MHKSQRMCLALYANGMLRLWNLLDARCIFKRKVGLIDEEQSSLEDKDDDQEESERSVEDSKRGLVEKFLNNP